MNDLPLRVLCVEDEPELREDLACELRDAGCVVWEAANGLEGLALALGTRFDVILCDIRMPQLDGMAMLAELRRSEGAGGQAPFVFLSAYDDPSLQEKGRLLGAMDFLLKPVSYDRLLDLLQRLKGRAG